MKLENILFETKEKTKIKIVDFGIAGMCKPDMQDKNDAGTLKYMAPEVLNFSHTVANPAIDIWALGIMIYIMIFRRFPFSGENNNEIKKNIINSELRFPPQPVISEDLQDLLKKILNKDPA